MTFDCPISFTWVYPGRKDEKQIVAYCFAYVKDRETKGVLYAGVKYKGETAELRRFRPFLRNTAIKRLLKKPIYGKFNLNEDAIKDSKHRFNGYDEMLEPRESVSLGKFFLGCGFANKYSNVGIYCLKNTADVKLVYKKDTDTYEIFGGKGVKMEKGSLINVRYGYILEENGIELKRINPQVGYIFGKGNEDLINLRKKAMFFGTKKDRRRLDSYDELTEHFLSQFGICRGRKVEEKGEIILQNYHRYNGILYFKSMISKNKRVHIAFMRFNNWLDYCSSLYDKSILATIESDSDIYCMGYSMEDMNMNDGKLGRDERRKLHKKIAIDRMIERPNILSALFFGGMNMKDLRIWFSSRISYLEVGGERLDIKEEMTFEPEMVIFENSRYSEEITFYRSVEKREMSILEKLICRIFA